MKAVYFVIHILVVIPSSKLEAVNRIQSPNIYIILRRRPLDSININFAFAFSVWVWECVSLGESVLVRVYMWECVSVCVGECVLFVCKREIVSFFVCLSLVSVSACISVLTVYQLFLCASAFLSSLPSAFFSQYRDGREVESEWKLVGHRVAGSPRQSVWYPQHEGRNADIQGESRIAHVALFSVLCNQTLRFMV